MDPLTAIAERRRPVNLEGLPEYRTLVEEKLSRRGASTGRTLLERPDQE